MGFSDRRPAGHYISNGSGTNPTVYNGSVPGAMTKQESSHFDKPAVRTGAAWVVAENYLTVVVNQDAGTVVKLGGQRVDVAFRTKLIGILPLVAPFDVGLLVLPVPRLGENDVVLVNPGSELHPAWNPAKSGFAVLTANADVVPAKVLCYHCKHLVVCRHAEIPPP